MVELLVKILGLIGCWSRLLGGGANDPGSGKAGLGLGCSVHSQNSLAQHFAEMWSLLHWQLMFLKEVMEEHYFSGALVGAMVD